MIEGNQDDFVHTDPSQDVQLASNDVGEICYEDAMLGRLD